jgi:hypothetical protein
MIASLSDERAPDLEIGAGEAGFLIERRERRFEFKLKISNADFDAAPVVMISVDESVTINNGGFPYVWRNRSGSALSEERKPSSRPHIRVHQAVIGEQQHGIGGRWYPCSNVAGGARLDQPRLGPPLTRILCRRNHLDSFRDGAPCPGCHSSPPRTSSYGWRSATLRQDRRCNDRRSAPWESLQHVGEDTPWRADTIPGGYVVRDADGQALAYVYSRDDPTEALQATMLAKDEARRVAVNVARLSELLGESD